MAYTYDLATHKVGSWGPAGGGMWGRSGPAVSKELVMYTGTGDGRWDPENGLYGNGIIGVKQNPETKALELVDYYGPSNAEWLWKRDLDMQVTPAIFDYKGKEYMIDASKECRIYLMDTESIGGDDHRTPVYRTPLICNEIRGFRAGRHLGLAGHLGGSTGTRWILTPFWGPKHSEVQSAHRTRRGEEGRDRGLQDGDGQGGKVQLTPGLDFARHESGRAAADRQRDGLRLRQRREYGAGVSRRRAGFPHGAPRSAFHARRALRAGCATGKELWSSGDQITNWNHWSGIAVANGQVYINTYDGKIYCFGLKK